MPGDGCGTGGEVGMKTNKYPIAEYDDLEMPSDDIQELAQSPR